MAHPRRLMAQIHEREELLAQADNPLLTSCAWPNKAEGGARVPYVSNVAQFGRHCPVHPALPQSVCRPSQWGELMPSGT